MGQMAALSAVSAAFVGSCCAEECGTGKASSTRTTRRNPKEQLRANALSVLRLEWSLMRRFLRSQRSLTGCEFRVAHATACDEIETMPRGQFDTGADIGVRAGTIF